MGARFVDAEELERLTGDRVRSAYRMPDEPKGLPAADAVVVAPATFNTVNKWAGGMADTFAVGLLCWRRWDSASRSWPFPCSRTRWLGTWPSAGAWMRCGR